MGRHHPDRETLSRFTEGELPPDEARGIERHLALCSDCRDRADEVSAVARLELLEPWLNSEYDQAFERAVLGVSEQLAGLWGERHGAEGLLSELLREPPARRRQRVREEERFHSVKLCQLLRSRGRESWFSDPVAGLDLSELAVLVAEALDPARYGSHLVEDARALSWAYLGNGFRIVSDLWRAEKALNRAWRHQQGGGDPYSEAELLKLTSSLRSLQNRHDEAVQLNDRAISVYREMRDRHSEGAALIQKGLSLGDHGRCHEASPFFRAGLARIDPERDSRLLLAGTHNLIWFLFEADAKEEALRLLDESRPLYHDVGDRVTLARLHWIEGYFAGKLGRFAEALAVLRESRELFLDLGLGLEVFSISLNLAEVYAQDGRRRQLKEVLEEAIPLGEAIGQTQEVLAAKLLYEQASRR